MAVIRACDILTKRASNGSVWRQPLLFESKIANVKMCHSQKLCPRFFIFIFSVIRRQHIAVASSSDVSFVASKRNLCTLKH